MKNIKGFAFGLVLGLGLAISSIGFAQTITQDDKQKGTESCCAMTSCCCSGDSCAMKHDSKTPSTMDHKGGCCCCGDSCATKMKDKEKVN